MTISKDLVLEGSAGRYIAADVFLAGNSIAAPLVIYAHGFNGFKDWGNFDLIAKQFAASGFNFIKFNFSHNGTTPEFPDEFVDLEAYGNDNYSKQLDDLGKVIDWAAGQPIDKTRIYLLGHSRGGGVVLLKAASDPRIKAVITWASVAEAKTPWGNFDAEKMKNWKTTGVHYVTNSRTRQELPLYYQLYEDYMANRKSQDIEQAVRALKIPLLICHGLEDSSVPPEQARRIHSWKPDATLFLTPGDHVFGRKHPWTSEDLPAQMQQVVHQSITFLKGLT